MWQELRIEKYVQDRLREEHDDGNQIFGRYLTTRTDIASNILPYIASKEPGLSDHGLAHIGNVMRNVGAVLGLNSAGQPLPNSSISDLTSAELILLLMGCLLHDIGNISGREKHNQATAQVWRQSGQNSWNAWLTADRRTIISICQAHTGKAADGSSDTLAPLAKDQRYFLSENVKAADLAATLRFADELAEGPQRTSQYLLAANEYGPDNVVYHQYAKCTTVHIDRQHGRIALDYEIDLDDEFFRGPEGLVPRLRALLELIYKRVVKLERERVFARHYAPVWLPYKETSVVMHIQRDHEPVCQLPPLILNDFNVRDMSDSRIPLLNEAYDIDTIIGQIDSGEAVQ